MKGFALAGSVLLSACLWTEGKLAYGKGYFGTDSINEITKFSFKPGRSEVFGNITFTGTPRGSLYMFMDTIWEEKFHGEEDCEKIKHAHTRIPIGRVGSHAGHGLGRAHGYEPYTSDVYPKFTTWKFEWVITHSVRTYGWYFVIADCAGYKNGDESSSEGDVTAPPTSKATKRKRKLKRNQFTYNIELYNPGRDHLPAEERGMTTLYSLVLLAMGSYFYKRTTDYKRKTGNGLLFDSHFIVKAFAVAYCLQLASMFLEVVHLFRYASNGYGVFIFDLLSELLEALSQVIISYALLCLGNGWTLVDLSQTSSWFRRMLNKPSLDDDAPLVFILIVSVFVSTILQLITKLNGDDFQKFHDFHGIAGKFLLLQRVGLGVAFMISISSTMKMDDVRGQVQLGGFLSRLRVFGTMWLFAFPLVVLIASLFAHYLQHIVVTGGVLVIQSICLTVMANQLFSNNSWYAKVSEVTSSGMLPGFGKGGKSY